MWSCAPSRIAHFHRPGSRAAADGRRQRAERLLLALSLELSLSLEAHHLLQLQAKLQLGNLVAGDFRGFGRADRRRRAPRDRTLGVGQLAALLMQPALVPM